MALASALLPGDPPRLGDYWLAGRVGAGGQGVVYEAYDPEGVRVAVKVLHGDAASDPALRNRFGKEATAARRVASFCTARVLAVDLDGPKPYIVGEYVEGRACAGRSRRAAGSAATTCTAWRRPWRPRWRPSTTPASSTGTSSRTTCSSGRTAHG
ncbi:hypothetical protein [Microtetraspora malaysiensis]|uniref:hypothetical protein n=1 Tax=Microtetraspora malaysiensis TaxID=161358 RepID=UPI003D93B235